MDEKPYLLCNNHNHSNKADSNQWQNILPKVRK